MKLLRPLRGSAPQRLDLRDKIVTGADMTVISFDLSCFAGISCFTEQVWHNFLILPTYCGRSLAVSDSL